MKIHNPTLLSFVLIILSLSAFQCSEDKINPDASGILSGTVTDAVTLDPLSDVTITTNPATQSVVSDSAGNFLLENIPVGEYNVIAKRDGYKTSSIAVNVGYNGETKASVSLEKRAGDLKIPEFSDRFIPASGATAIRLDSVIAWELIQGKDSVHFTLNIYETGSMEKVSTYSNLTDTFFYPENLKFETCYFWQVEAANNAGRGYSAMQSFQTISFPANEILFSRNAGGTSQLFVSDTTGAEIIQLTDGTHHSWNGKINRQHSKIAYVSTNNMTPQLYITDVNGINFKQLTNLSFGTYFSNSVYFAWDPAGAQLFFTNADKLFSVQPDGTDTKVI
ncbi:MAG TPA: carboxypeptidase regulatory-like domain-containing protein, partial [Bacteroidales bacterium]|nr:carboxypeptidase regulatory-like domain-containing protein [Bacteroidales bacterium]